MSIINEALKKTQLNRKLNKDENEDDQDKKTDAPKSSEASTSKSMLQEQPINNKNKPVKKIDVRFTWRMASFLTVTALLAMMLLANYQSVKPINTSHMQTAMKSREKVSITFEGVFHSHNTKIALINKQSMQIGDMVHGMKIVAINHDSVEIQGENGVIKLHAGGTYML